MEHVRADHVHRRPSRPISNLVLCKPWQAVASEGRSCSKHQLVAAAVTVKATGRTRSMFASQKVRRVRVLRSSYLFRLRLRVDSDVSRSVRLACGCNVLHEPEMRGRCDGRRWQQLVRVPQRQCPVTEAWMVVVYVPTKTREHRHEDKTKTLTDSNGDAMEGDAP